MNALIKAWKYTDEVSEERRERLASSGSFDELSAQVVDEAIVDRVKSCAGRDSGLTHCLQPVFFVTLATTGDALFNGPYGYRAQYWVSPGNGLGANSELLRALAPKLLSALKASDDPDIEKVDVCASLRCPSAKIWPLESEMASTMINPSRALEISRWVTEADRGVELATWGIAAPDVSTFQVKGALMDPYGHEVVPARKTHRHYDIFNYGFS